VVVVAALYSHPDLLKHNRKNFIQYFEVYLHSSIEVLQKREFKGLYQKALNKEILNVVGVDIPWNTPVEPDMVFDLLENLSPELMADKLFECLPNLSNS
jgi:adenylylsulfate kinase